MLIHITACLLEGQLLLCVASTHSLDLGCTLRSIVKAGATPALTISVAGPFAYLGSRRQVAPAKVLLFIKLIGSVHHGLSIEGLLMQFIGDLAGGLEAAIFKVSGRLALKWAVDDVPVV